MLKFKLSKDDYEGLEDAVRNYYQQGDDGNFYLQVEGAVSKDKLNEFRDNNIELNNQLKKFEGVDLNLYSSVSELGLDADGIKNLQETQKKFRDKKLYDDKDIDGLVSARVNDRVNEMKTEHDGVVKELNTKLQNVNGQLETVMVDKEITDAAIEAGARDTALEDIKLRARQIYRYNEGSVMPVDKDGNTIYGTDGTNPMAPKEWAKKLRTSAPHLFEESKGGGMPNRGSSANGQDRSKMSATDKITQGLASRT